MSAKVIPWMVPLTLESGERVEVPLPAFLALVEWYAQDPDCARALEAAVAAGEAARLAKRRQLDPKPR